MTDNPGMVILRFLFPILACLPLQAAALELFGVDLEKVDRAALREAVERAGIELVRERDEVQGFDVYDSSAVLRGSWRLYLGATPDGSRVAFVEYEFVGRHLRRLRAELSRKYGDATVSGGEYLSDHAYSWRRDGIDIRLVYDWANYRTRLSYIEPEAFARMRDIVAPSVAENDESAPVSLF